MNDGFKILLGSLGGAIVVLLLVSVLGRGGMMSGGMMGGGLIGGLFSLLFWGLVLALIVALMVWIVDQTQRW